MLPNNVKQILFDLRRVELLGINAAKKTTLLVKAATLQALKKDAEVNVSRIMIAGLQSVLTKSMLVSHLLGARRAFLEAPVEAPLALSEKGLNDLEKILERTLKVDIATLEAKYSTEALRILKGSSDAIEKELRTEVNRIISGGLNSRDAIKALGQKFDNLGLTPKNEFQLETIFRTQTQIAHGAGQWEAYQKPEIDEILWGYKYVTTGDDRVRDSHAPLDGTVLPKDDTFWQRFWPPNGWNCRCKAIPIFSPREEKRPPTSDEEGNLIVPDKGFDWNPGKVFGTRDGVTPKTDLNKTTDPVKDKKVEKELQKIESKREKEAKKEEAKVDKLKQELEDLQNKNAKTEEEIVTVKEETKQKKRELKLLEPKVDAKPPEVRTVYDENVVESSPVTENFKKEVISAFQAVPKKHFEALKTSGVTIDVGAKLIDIRPDMKGVRPQGYPEGYTWENSSGFYSWGRKQVAVSEMVRKGPGSDYEASDRTAGTMAHEVGHAIDANYKKDLTKEKAKLSKLEAKELSLRDDWKQAQAEKDKAFYDYDEVAVKRNSIRRTEEGYQEKRAALDERLNETETTYRKAQEKFQEVDKVYAKVRDDRANLDTLIKQSQSRAISETNEFFSVYKKEAMVPIEAALKAEEAYKEANAKYKEKEAKLQELSKDLNAASKKVNALADAGKPYMKAYEAYRKKELAYAKASDIAYKAEREVFDLDKARGKAVQAVEFIEYQLQRANGLPTFAGAAEAFAELYAIGIAEKPGAIWMKDALLNTFPKTLEKMKEILK
jgi:SPP1 gp7 family putative phage head morphogenesis protein